MKKTLVMLTIIITPLLSTGQMRTNQGIHFEHGLSWDQIKAKAKAEKKYIFADCFATWCGPCKEMDNEVYPNDTIGNFVNAHFISVKVQMDTTKTDNAEIKKWYTSAKALKYDGNVNAFPSYIFFSPDGKLVTKSMGAMKVSNFLVVLNDALDPSKQYYTLLESYYNKKLDLTLMPYLSRKAKSLSEINAADELASDYIHNYLDKLSEREFCKKDNLDFINFFYSIITSKDRIFDFYYRQQTKADSILASKGYSQRFIDYIINKEELKPLVTIAKKNNSDVDWNMLNANISKKYNGVYADRIITSEKPSFYKNKKEYNNYGKSLAVYIEKYGKTMSLSDLNNSAWDVFERVTDSLILKKALLWSDKTIQNEPKSGEYYDTYANLSYKLGKKSDAYLFEEKAINLSPNNTDFKSNLEKMKKGQKTWPY